MNFHLYLPMSKDMSKYISDSVTKMSYTNVLISCRP